MNQLKSYSFFILLGLMVNAISVSIGSCYLINFLDKNLIFLQIALLAINTATISIIFSKIREISDRHENAGFTKTFKSLKTATFEQLILIIIAVAMEILKTSPYIIEIFNWSVFIFNSVLISVFFMSLQIVYDTARAVYILVDHGH